MLANKTCNVGDCYPKKISIQKNHHLFPFRKLSGVILLGLICLVGSGNTIKAESVMGKFAFTKIEGFGARNAPSGRRRHEV